VLPLGIIVVMAVLGDRVVTFEALRIAENP
jgi:hypothetical protein